MSRYTVKTVLANKIDGGGPNALEDALNSIHDSQELKAVLPWAQGGGYTDKWVLVIDNGPRPTREKQVQSNE